MTWVRHGQILDCGAGYREFMVTEEFAEDLLNGGMTHVNGRPVRLSVVDRLEQHGAVLLRWYPLEEAACAS